MRRSSINPLAAAWAVSLVAVWLGVAVVLGQSPVATQRSADLVAFGAFKGSDLLSSAWPDAWRLVASQWLHVKFPHMLLNAAFVAMLGTVLARRTSGPVMLLTGVFGGAIGQLVSALAYPDAFVSGASQAYLALAGAILVAVGVGLPGWWLAVVAAVVAAAIDLFASGHGGIKAGHVAGLLAGALIGALATARTGRPQRSPRSRR